MRYLIINMLMLLGVSGCALHNHPVLPPPPPPEPCMQIFIDKMATIHHFNRQQLIELLRQTEFQPEVINKLNQPFEKKPWNFYQHFFVRADRVHRGVSYWKKHVDALNQAEERYGIPPHIIVAIIGMETDYGGNMGHFPELSTLVTIACHYPQRADFFQKELEHYLLLTREYQLQPLTLQGSYAGALGIPQFMPSSYRQYAVSYDGKKQINLLQNHNDAIFSIALFLQKSGWRRGELVAVPARMKGKKYQWLISNTTKPIYRVSTLSKFGIKSSQKLPKNIKGTVIAMDSLGSIEYWLTFNNFDALMHYNPRTTYTLAAYLFSEAIKKEYEKGTSQARRRTAKKR